MATSSTNHSSDGEFAPRGPSGPKSGIIFWSILAAAIVFGGFVAYAYLTPATYHTRAEIRLEGPKASLAELPKPEAAKERLRQALLQPGLFSELGRLLGADSPAVRLQLASAVKEGLKLTTADSRTFSFHFSDSDPERAQKACNLIARRAAELAPRVLLKPRSEPPSPRQQHLEKLLAFLEKHPEVSAASGEPASAPEAEQVDAAETSKPVGDDPLLIALTAERRAALLELKKLESVAPDNPYADGIEGEIRAVNARLREIERGISSRRKGLEGKGEQGAEGEPEVTAEVQHTWSNMLQQLMDQPEPNAAAAAPAPKAKALVVREAAFPRWPVTPDRQLLLLIGSLVALVIAAIGVIKAMVATRRAPVTAPGSVAEPVAPAEPGPAAQQLDSSEAMAPPPPQQTSQAAPEPEPPQNAPFEPVREQPLVPHRMLEMRQTEREAAEKPLPSEAPTDPPEQTANNEAAADRVKERPRTFLGGFRASGESSQNTVPGAASAIPRPISIRGTPMPGSAEIPTASVRAVREGLLTVDATGVEVVSPQLPAGDSIAAAAARSETTGDAPATVSGAAHRPSARKKTQMLGSPVWATGQQQAAQQPPGPGAGASQSGRAQQGHTSTPEPGVALARPRLKLPLVLTQPPPPGWTLDASLIPEALGRLCHSLAQQPRQGCLVIGVAGFAELSVEKSRMAAGLAAGLSHGAHHRTLLIEGDFQTPTAHRSLSVEMPISAGLSQQLQARRNKGAPQDRPWVVVECGATLHVLGEGVIRSPGAILSQQYEVCLKELRASYDMIVVDGPAVTSEVESRAFAQLVDGMVIATPRAGMELPYDITAMFSGSRFLLSHPCLV